jgi:hypothetical protein
MPSRRSERDFAGCHPGGLSAFATLSIVYGAACHAVIELIDKDELDPSVWGDSSHGLRAVSVLSRPICTRSSVFVR